MDLTTLESTADANDKETLRAVFSEVNDHIRATDSKNVTMAGIYTTIVIIGVAKTFDAVFEDWAFVRFFAALSFSIIGLLSVLLQVWYRHWKEHYLCVARNIRIQVSPHIDSHLLPNWLHKDQPNHFSPDRFVIWISSVSVVFAIVVTAIQWQAFLITQPLSQELFYVFSGLGWVLCGMLPAVGYVVTKRKWMRIDSMRA